MACLYGHLERHISASGDCQVIKARINIETVAQRVRMHLAQTCPARESSVGHIVVRVIEICR